MNVALQQLLSAVEKHRLTFLFCAYPQRKNPMAVSSETGVWETVRKQGFPGWAEMEKDADDDGKFLFRHCAVLDAYADEAISLFGPGDGCRPRIQTKEGDWVDVEGGALPYWSLEERLCHELENSSQAILDTCAEVSSADTECALTPLLKQVMAIAHDKGQSRWYGSVGVRWGYLSDLDAAIDAIRKASVTQPGASNGDEELAAAGQSGLEPIRQLASALTQLRLATVALLHVFGKTDAYPASQVKAYHEALRNAKSCVGRISQHLAYGEENPKKIKTDVRECIRSLSRAAKHLLSDWNESLAAHPVSKEKTEPVWEAVRAGMAIELVLTMATLKPDELQMPVEDRRVSGLILLLLLAQAYYKMLECTISMADWCSALDLELNQSYLWVTTSLKNLLKNHNDLKDFPATFEPLFPDLYPSTIRDLDWDDMVAPEAEKFLSMVQQYVHGKGVYEPEKGSKAWTFIELFRPAVETAVERAIAYNRQMRQYAQKAFGASAAGCNLRTDGSANAASGDEHRRRKACAPVADDAADRLRENGVSGPAIEDPPTEAESRCVAFTHVGRRYLNGRDRPVAACELSERQEPSVPSLTGDAGRFRWLCQDMIKRLQQETDATGFGGIDLRLEEAASLALGLGFGTPPICSMCYIVDHEVHNYTLDRKENASLAFLLAEYRIPHLLAIWFYRVYDPAGGEPVDIVKAGETRGDEATERPVRDPWGAEPKAESRAKIIKILNRWIHAVEGRVLSESDAAPEPGEARGEEGVVIEVGLAKYADGWHWFVDGEDKGCISRRDDTIICKISRILFDQIGQGWTPHKTFYQKLGWKDEEYFGKKAETGRMQKQLNILRRKLGLTIVFRKEHGVRFDGNVVKS